MAKDGDLLIQRLREAQVKRDIAFFSPLFSLYLAVLSATGAGMSIKTDGGEKLNG